MKGERDRPVTEKVLREAEELIGTWDQNGGMSYRELAVALRGVFANDEQSKLVQ